LILNDCGFRPLSFASESGKNMESIRQSHINTVNELNQQLFGMKGAYEQLDVENQRLTNELEKLSVELNRDQSRQTIGMFILFYREYKEKKLAI
jgi:hypothetical protein